MPDENPVIDAGQFLGEDGAFSENWLEQAYLEDDPMRKDPTLVNTKSVRSMASQLVNSQKQIGQLSGGRDFAILPNEQSDEAEIAAYHTKIGRPDAPEGYEFDKVQLAEGQQKDEKLIARMSKTLFDAGASKGVAAAALKGYVEHQTETLAAMATQDKLEAQEANKKIRATFGAAYDGKMAKAVAACRILGGAIDPEAAEEMVKELPYDEFAAQLFDRVADIIGEKGLKEVPGAPSGVMTPADARTAFNELTKDPYYMTASPKDKPKNQQYHDELIQKGVKLITLSKAGTS